MTIIDGLKNLRPKVAVGAMLVASAAIFVSSAQPTRYAGTADDLTQIQQLLAKYDNALDGDDPAGFASVFTENAVWHSGIGEQYRCLIGPAAITDLVRAEAQRVSTRGQYPHSHMTVLGQVTFVDENNAYSHQTSIIVGSQGFVQALKGGADLAYTGYSNDTFQRVNGRWRIATRDSSSGYNPATRLHDLKYHPPRTCPPSAATSTTSAASAGTAARTATSTAAARP